MDHHLSPGPVKEPQYGSLDTLTRSLHFPDFQLCYDQKKMATRPIKMGKNSYLGGIGEILWFGPSLSTTFDHNWYGNVSFIISLQDLVDRFGSNFYYVDKQEFETHIASRTILSKKSLTTLPRVDTSTYGSPIFKESNRHWQHVTKCRSSRFGTILQHRLEIAIEADSNDCKWIYKQATIKPNSHHLANTMGIGFGSTACHRYNTFNKNCPYQLSRDMTFQKLMTEYPLYNFK